MPHADPDVRRAYHKAYSQRWRALNADREREKAREWSAANPNKVRARWQRYYRKHKAAARARSLAWYHAHPKPQRYDPDYRHNYWLTHREEAKAATRAYFARRRGAKGHATATQIMQRIAYYGWRCYLCGAPWQEVDHVIPLVRGGTNWPANQRPTCRRCNRRKSAEDRRAA